MFKYSLLNILVSLALLPSSSFCAEPEFDEVGTGLETIKGTGISLLIEELSPDATAIGLTEEYLTARIEMQLRKNGLKLVKSFAAPEVYVNVGVMKSGAFSWRIAFKRSAIYEVDGKRYLSVSAATYTKSGFGSFNPNRAPANLHERITSSLISDIDILSNEILGSVK